MKKVIALVSIAAFAISASTASARWIPQSNDVDVNNSNSANVTNSVSTTANTGGNETVGGSAKNYASKGTNVAVGGEAASLTGDAVAASSVENYVNSNKTVVDVCGCEGKGDITVNNKNKYTNVTNGVSTVANTGENATVGGYAKNKVSGGFSWWHHGSSSNTAVGGAAYSETGSAAAGSSVVNVVNKNITRIK